jgi:hypothetical protein
MSMMTPARVAAVLAFLLSSCGGATDQLAGGVGSNTNWLSPCLDGSSCGEGLSCLCGVCTTSCASVECTGGIQCVMPSGDACESATEPVCLSLCASDASCVASLGEGFACVSGRCEAQPVSGGLASVSDAAVPSDPAGASGSNSTPEITMIEPASQERIERIRSLTNSPPPAECVQGLPALLPGCDPDALAYSGIDCDGDGVPVFRLWRCEVATAERPPDYGGNYDCQPSDPGLSHWVVADTDGDGFGYGEPFCAGPGIPQGYIQYEGPGFSEDCDDHDSAVHPGAPEILGDLLDSDCREGDSPSCDVLTSGTTYERLPVAPTDCPGGGSDLFLSSLAHCGDRCPSNGAFYMFVGNAGTTDAPGPIRVVWSDDTGAGGTIEVSPGDLAPGGITPTFTVPTNRSNHTEVAIDFEDCKPENGKFVDDNLFYTGLDCL